MSTVENKSQKTKNPIVRVWNNFREKNPGIAEFLTFFIVSNGITLLQMLLMPLFRFFLDQTNLVNVNFQVLPVGQDVGGGLYYVFNYAAGEIASGGGGGLAYFLSVQITMAIAQVINFFVQRNVTFKSNNNIVKAAMWYFIAYIVITIGAAALQGLYKVPIYNFFMETLSLGNTGAAIADAITMIINSAISFWVFYPIFKVIFKDENKV